MTISPDGVLSFLIEPDYETQNEHLTEVTASNDSGSDTINVKVKVVDTLCEFDTAAVFDECFFESNLVRELKTFKVVNGIILTIDDKN